MGYIENLKEYIELDRALQKNQVESDFEKYCEDHCKDIEQLINEAEELKENKININNNTNNYVDIKKEKQIKKFNIIKELIEKSE